MLISVSVFDPPIHLQRSYVLLAIQWSGDHTVRLRGHSFMTEYLNLNSMLIILARQFPRSISKGRRGGFLWVPFSSVLFHTVWVDLLPPTWILQWIGCCYTPTVRVFICLGCCAVEIRNQTTFLGVADLIFSRVAFPAICSWAFVKLI